MRTAAKIGLGLLDLSGITAVAQAGAPHARCDFDGDGRINHGMFSNQTGADPERAAMRAVEAGATAKT